MNYGEKSFLKDIKVNEKESYIFYITELASKISKVSTNINEAKINDTYYNNEILKVSNNVDKAKINDNIYNNNDNKKNH